MTGLRVLWLALAWLTIAGCSGSSGTAFEDDFDTGVTDGVGGGTSSTGDDALRSGSEFAGAVGDGPSGTAALDNRVVYFEFDRAEVLPEYNAVLAAHGEWLASNPDQRVRLEGHADERGSREYNIGLGERRSQAVRQLLLLQGVSAIQMSTVSYGEERPAVLGSDEEALALNRRVELVYGQ